MEDKECFIPFGEDHKKIRCSEEECGMWDENGERCGFLSIAVRLNEMIPMLEVIQVDGLSRSRKGGD